MTDRLNPEALSRASDAVTELYADGYCPKAEDAAEVAVSAYLAAATPEMDTDTLACKIMWKDLPFGGNPDNYIRLDANAAHAVIELLRPHLAALPAPRTIKTVEGLEALPVGTVIQDFNDDIMQIIELDNDDTSTRERGGVREFGFEEGRFEFLSWVKLPAMVLWVPTEGGGE